ncbi:hypothetical protein EIP91_008336 [Steccherinum ochraceum]|uniref:Dynein light intermediate chain n=1 Tax=Steccherinum ochraceum TaxID=92696 RepID=A0A4R0RPY4_9APHY|nr:hypothetical protein EIP91_008336 [Steccherinum ochraceum]
MVDSRPASPEEQPQDLWSSILDSVSTSRSTPSKQILVLGQPSTGKTSLAAALLQKASTDEVKEDQRLDFALGYDWADVRDDADEDTLARLSVYTVPSAASSYTALLPHFLPPRNSIPHTVVMIVLDWTKPWLFLEELHMWLSWVEQWVQGDSARELVIAREENRERLQAHLQHYTEPSSDPDPAAASTLSNTLLPLGPGTFTHNIGGVPIAVVCTKADLIDEGNDVIGAGASGMGGMVKGKGGEWEERTDGIMQILRTVCLKYGAGLFYTTPLPHTLQVLRQYALHMLFMPPAPSPAMAGSEAPAPTRNPFPFLHKPNTLDRDRIVIPSGWDSWGKISVLRDGFDAKAWGEAWERDLEQTENEPAEEPGAKKMFASLPPPLPPFNNPTPEQVFLAKNYDENARRTDRDPRGAFKNPVETSAAGIVGPMGSSSFNLPNVEKALTDMESGFSMSSSTNLGASVNGDPSRKASGRSAGRPAGNLTVPGPGGVPGRSPVASPTLSTTPSPTSGQTQHEVLQNFFQSLLSSKDRPGASTSVRTSGSGPPKPGSGDATDEGS